MSEPAPEERMIRISHMPRVSSALIIILVSIIIAGIVAYNAVAFVPAGYRGVLITRGKVEEVNLPEGLVFKTPFVQEVVMVKTMIQKAEVTESTASNDSQEITTQLAVHYRIREDSAWKVYQTMRQDYQHLVIEPVIMEELKATTADWSAEDLIAERPLVVIQLMNQINARLNPFGIDVLTVNIIDINISPKAP